jgi:hypothetical protein
MGTACGVQSGIVTTPDWRSLLRRSFDEYYGGLWKALSGLTPAERRYRATGETNHIDFIVWHMARNEDDTVSACARVEALWPRSEWPQRWSLAVDSNGCGFTSEDVEHFPTLDVRELHRYFSDVRARTDAYLDVLAEDTLDDLVWPENPEVTIGQLLGHFIVEQSQHFGQVALIRGMQRGTEFTTSWNNPQTPTLS